MLIEKTLKLNSKVWKIRNSFCFSVTHQHVLPILLRFMRFMFDSTLWNRRRTSQLVWSFAKCCHLLIRNYFYNTKNKVQMIQGLVFIKNVMFSLEWPQENTVAWEMKQKITIARAKEYIISLHVSLTDIHILYSFSSQLSFDNRCSLSCKQRKITAACFIRK